MFSDNSQVHVSFINYVSKAPNKNIPLHYWTTNKAAYILYQVIKVHVSRYADIYSQFIEAAGPAAAY